MIEKIHPTKNELSITVSSLNEDEKNALIENPKSFWQELEAPDMIALLLWKINDLQRQNLELTIITQKIVQTQNVQKRKKIVFN